MKTEKRTPAQSLTEKMRRAFATPVQLTDRHQKALNQLSTTESNRFFQLLKNLDRLNASPMINNTPDTTPVPGIIDLLENYTLKDIEMVFNSLAHYNLLTFIYVTQFVGLMKSFIALSDRQNFIELLYYHTTVPLVPMALSFPLNFIKDKENRPYFFTLFQQSTNQPMISMRWRLPMYPGTEQVTPLLLLQGQSEKIALVNRLTKKIMHTEYLKQYQRDIYSKSAESMRYMVEIIDLLSDFKLASHDNLLKILTNAQMQNNTSHSPMGLYVQSQILKALSKENLLTQRNVNEIYAIKYYACAQPTHTDLVDSSSPIVSFIPVLLDLAHRSSLSQHFLNELSSNVKKALQEKDYFLWPLPESLAKLSSTTSTYSEEKRMQMTKAFFEGSNLTFQEKNLLEKSNTLKF